MHRAAAAFAGLVVGVLVSSGAALGAVDCPPSMDGHPLERVSVFDGPPADMVDLRPEERGRIDTWAELDRALEAATLVCRYKGVSKSTELPLPKGTRACEGVRRADDTYQSVSCR